MMWDEDLAADEALRETGANLLTIPGVGKWVKG
jgi:hypothetical protein